MINIKRKNNGLQVEATIIPVGDDYNVIITGGDKPHIGSVAVGIPYKQNNEVKVISSVLTAPGHKEDVISAKAAKKIASGVCKVVTVSCGIHKDNIKPEEIDGFINITDELINEILEKIS